MRIERNGCSMPDEQVEEISNYAHDNRWLLARLYSYAAKLEGGVNCVDKLPGFVTLPRMRTLGDVWYNRKIGMFQTQHAGYDFSFEV